MGMMDNVNPEVSSRHRRIRPVAIHSDDELRGLGSGRRFVWIVRRRGRSLTIENSGGVSCKIREEEFVRLALDRAQAGEAIEEAKDLARERRQRRRKRGRS